MLRSVLGTGLLVNVSRAALSVAAPRGGGIEGMSPKHKFFRAERVKIDSKNFQNVKLTAQSLTIFKIKYT